MADVRSELAGSTFAPAEGQARELRRVEVRPLRRVVGYLVRLTASAGTTPSGVSPLYVGPIRLDGRRPWVERERAERFPGSPNGRAAAFLVADGLAFACVVRLTVRG